MCSAPPDVLDAVNAAIRAKEKFRDLAARTAFSRASLHRHASKCISRDAVAAHKAGKFNPVSDLLWTQWPDGEITLQGVPHDFQKPIPVEPRGNDTIIRVQFEPAVAPRAVKVSPDVPVE